MNDKETRPLNELSDAELEALADLVEAGRPLDYPYFRWTQHVRRYALFYWAMFLFVIMGKWNFHDYQLIISKSLHWQLTVCIAIVTWWLSPRIADKCYDVRETVREVVYRLAKMESEVIKSDASKKEENRFWKWVACSALFNYVVFWLAHYAHLYPPVTAMYIICIACILCIFIPSYSFRFFYHNKTIKHFDQSLKSFCGKNVEHVITSKQYKLQAGIYGKRKVWPLLGFIRWFFSIIPRKGRSMLFLPFFCAVAIVFNIYFFADLSQFNTLFYDDTHNFSIKKYFSKICRLLGFSFFSVMGVEITTITYMNYKTDTIWLAIKQIRHQQNVEN
jgi:hypothetical protein